MFCKLWSHPQILAVVLENKFCIYRRLKQLEKLQSLGGNQEVTESNLPFSSRPLQMKTRWHFQQTAFKWNVKCVWRNLKHHKLLEHKALPPFSPKGHQGPRGIHIFLLEVHKGKLLGTSWGTHLFSWLWWACFKVIILPHAFKSHLCNSTTHIIFFLTHSQQI